MMRIKDHNYNEAVKLFKEKLSQEEMKKVLL